MAAIRLTGVSSRAGGQRPVISDLTLSVHDGEVLVIVGPSGSGKTTILRLIAGLEEAVEGEIWIGEREVTHLRPDARDIAMVFQEQALIQQLSVRDNIGFPLRIRRLLHGEVRRRVEAEARVLGIRQLLERRPSTLAAGERQAASVARTTVRVPAAYLMDEPLAPLDARERQRLRAELTSYVRELGVTTVYVTNDPTEALAVGDRIAVLGDGRIHQLDRAEAVYARPASVLAATLVGSPSMGLVRGRTAFGERRAWLQLGRQAVALPPLSPSLRGRLEGQEVLAGCRPDALELVSVDADGVTTVQATVAAAERLGSSVELHLDLQGAVPVDQGWTVRAEPHATVAPGDEVVVRVRVDRLSLFDPVTEQAVVPSTGTVPG